MKEICTFFEVENSHELTWAHQVNSTDLLDACCANSSIMMLEGDVVFTDACTVPMMASPFKLEGVVQPSSLSFQQWLATTSSNHKGVKIDIQSPAALEPTLAVLAELQPETPVILHADVFNLLNDDVAQFEPEMFVQLSQRFFPSATLSMGWSLTREQDEDGKMESVIIEQMTDLILEKLGGVAYTIELRAGYTPNWEKGAAFIFEPIDGVE
ncbi:MAG: DUF2181 domain-containing protein, partial [Alphaproteobacteria bacterium]|nr:DUF2181 domain-containing protein [Alphaproteobacteria bacterium]